MAINRRRLNRRILGTVLGFSLTMGIAAALLFLRLSAGPLDLHFADGVVRPGLQRLLGDEGRADFSRLELEWIKGRLRVRVADFSVRRLDGQLIVKAPGAYVGFSVFDLLAGNIEPATLEVTRPLLALTISADGSIALGATQARKSAPEPVPVLGLLEPEFMARLLPYGQHMFGRGALHALRLEDVTVVVTDDRWNITRSFDPFTVDLQRTLTQNLNVEISAPDKRGGFGVSLKLGPVRDGARDVHLETKHFSLASLVPDDSDIYVADTLIIAKLSARLNENGLVTPLTGEIALDAGQIRGEDIDIEFAPLLLKAKLETDARTLTIAPARFSMNGAEGLFSGRILFPAAGDPTRPVRLDVKAEDLAFNDGKRFPEVGTIVFAGAYELANRTLWIDHLRAGAKETVAELKGTARFTNTTPELKLSCEVGAISVEAAKALWPSVTAPPVRKWVKENVEGGQIEKGRIDVAIPAGWLDGRPLLRQFVKTEWNVKNIGVKLSPDLPLAKGVMAQIEVTGNSARVDALGGKIALPAGDIDLPNAVFNADDFAPKKPFGRLNLLMVGSMQALVQLAERNKFKLGSAKEGGNSGFQIGRLKGEALANVEVQIPLWKEAKLSETKTSLEAELRNVTGEDVFDNKDLKDGVFQVKLEAGTLSAEGTATVDDVPFKIFMSRDTADHAVLRAEVEADEALRAKLGIDLKPWVTGTTVVRRVEDFSADTSQRIEVDLTAAKFSVPQLHFDKAPGQQALLSFIPKGEKQISVLEDFHLRGKNWLMRGQICLDDKGAASLVEFSDIRLRPDDNFSARIERGPRSTLVQISGRSIDLRPFLAQILSSDSQNDKPDIMNIDLRVDKAIGSNGETIRNLRLSSNEDGGRVTTFNLGGELGQGASLLGQIQSDRGRPYMIVTTNDGGALLRFLDIYGKVGGGRLTLTQTLTDSPSQVADGVVFLEQFRFVNEPAIQRLFGASPQSQGGPKQIDDNPGFDRLRVAFSRVPGLIHVREGVLRNMEIGITFQGQIDFRRSLLDMKGSFIPMYALNNLMARLPVVGLFMGGPNEGLLGVTFAINGTLSNPVLRINPASMIAPGFLRGLFQVQNEQPARR